MKRKQLAAPVRAPEAKQQTNPSTSRDTLSPTSERGHPLLELHPMFGNRKIGRVLQAKLKVSEPGDAYERQADAVAEMVMRMPGGEAPAISNGPPQIQRRCRACEEEDETLRFKRAPGSVPEVTPSVAASIDAIRGGGQPLPTSTRAFFEPRFGYDFSDVRMHTNGRASDAARQVRAQAFTVGRDVVFGDGQYSPETQPGRQLLAHELTHVVQQMPLLSRKSSFIQRMPEDGSRTPTEAESQKSATPTEEATATEMTDEPAEERQSTPGLIVEDSADELTTGQMKKGAFLAELRTEVCSAAEEVLASTGQTTEGCPYLDYWFDFYGSKDSQHIERAIQKYSPEASSATTARDYIPIVTARVRSSVETWASTGEITGVPEELRSAMIGATALSALGSVVSGIGRAVSSIAGGIKKGLSAIGGIHFKGRPGASREAADPEAIRSQLGPGRPLDGAVKSRMESAFGAAFSGVRIHTDQTAQGLSDHLDARAFTIGSDIAFGSGEYRPGTLVGDALLAHELAHVAQQDGGKAANGPLQKGDAESTTLEEEADVSAVGAVVSMWGGTNRELADIGRNAMPRLRSGLRLQRCKSERNLKSPRLAGNPLLENVLDKKAVIKLGHKGPEVRRLQQLLIDLGITLTTDFANGDFGADTENAVKVYQRSKKIPDNGIVDSVTIEKLDADFPAIALPSTKSNPWTMPCVLGILCPWNKNLVTKVLPTFDIVTFDKREFPVQTWNGTTWDSSTFTSGGFRGGTKMGFLNSTTCEEMAFTIYHEGWHGQQPSTMTGVVEAETSAYIAAEQWSIDIGVPGQGTFRNEATLGIESFRGKKGGETVVNEPAAETFVKQEYGGVSSVPGERVIARVGASDVRVLKPDGTSYIRPAAVGESVRGAVVMTGEATIDKGDWVCP